MHRTVFTVARANRLLYLPNQRRSTSGTQVAAPRFILPAFRAYAAHCADKCTYVHNSHTLSRGQQEPRDAARAATKPAQAQICASARSTAGRARSNRAAPRRQPHSPSAEAPQETMDKYHIFNEIGAGKNSQVFKGRQKKTVTYVAVKRVAKDQMSKS